MEKPGDFAFLDFLENIRVVHLDGHHPCAFLDGLLSRRSYRKRNIALDDGRLFERLERVLHIHLIAVLGEPVRGLGDFLLRHVIAVSVLCEGLIDNAGDVVAISIRVDRFGRKKQKEAEPCSALVIRNWFLGWPPCLQG